MVYVLVGCAAGLIINPYFPHNLQLLIEHMQIKLTASEFNTKVGSEWYPYDSWEFLGNSAVACIAMFVGYIAFEPSERRRVSLPALLSALFDGTHDHDCALEKDCGILAAVCRAVCRFFAAAMAGRLSSLSHASASGGTWRNSNHFSIAKVSSLLKKTLTCVACVRTIAVAAVALALSVFLFFNLRATVKEIGQSEPHDHYRAGAEWMRTNVPPGQMVFNTDWDDFPRLFYYDPSHYYVSGLDPSYLFDKDPDLSRLYDRITLGTEERSGPVDSRSIRSALRVFR